MAGLDGIGYYNCMVASGSFMGAIIIKYFTSKVFIGPLLCCSSKLFYPVGCNAYAEMAALLWRDGSSSLMQIGRGWTLKG